MGWRFWAQPLSPHVGPTLARKKAKSGATRSHHPCRLHVCRLQACHPTRFTPPCRGSASSHFYFCSNAYSFFIVAIFPPFFPLSAVLLARQDSNCDLLLSPTSILSCRAEKRIADCLHRPHTEVRDTWTGDDSHRPRPFPHHSFKTGPLSPALAQQTHSSLAANILAPFVSRRAHRGSCSVQEGWLLTTEQPVDRRHRRVVDVDLNPRPDASPRRPSRPPIPESEFGGLVPLSPAGIRNKIHPGHSCPDH